MRISTENAYAATIDALQQRQQRLADAQQQLSSGKRVARPSDDPAAAALLNETRIKRVRHKRTAADLDF